MSSVPKDAEVSDDSSASEEQDLSSVPELPGRATVYGVVAGWSIGVLLLAGLISFILHFSDIRIFFATIRAANPLWLAAGAICQLATYVCAAGVWSRVLKKAGVRKRLSSLLGLAVVELFANQAVPTGGLSGSVMVVRGLAHRGVPSAIALTALLVAALSYYAAYFLVALLAFILLWHSGDFSNAWLSLSIAFLFVVIIIAAAVLAVTRSRGRFIPKSMLGWRPAARLADLLGRVRTDILRDGRVIGETVVLQSLVFLLDAATLWCAARAVGIGIDPGSAFISFVLASVVATLSPIPLGLGSFEGTSTAMLHLMGGGVEAGLAATLILRGFTLWLPMIPGLWLIRRETRNIGSHNSPS